MRRDIYEGVQLYVNQKIKPNYAELTRQYRSDYRTVKSAYEQGIKNKKNGEQKRKVKNSRPSNLDPFKPIIEEKLLLGCSAKAIFKFIEKKGFEGKYTIVREYCKDHKAEKIKQATIRVTHQPALAGQVDWKEEMKLISREDEIYQFNLFLCSPSMGEL